MKKQLKDINVSGKKVLVRVDYNVPIKDGKVTNDKRISASLPTIKHLIKNDAKIVLFSHLGRIKTDEDEAKKSLKPAAEQLAKLLNKEVKFISQTRGKELEAAINNLKNGELLMFENTRFEDVENNKVVKKESGNDSELGKYWASLGDVFVNDAFGTAHRAHASNVGIAKNIATSALGMLVDNEVKMLSKALDNPQSPVISIIGGAKVSDKINVIESLMKISDKIIICGGMTYTFWKAQGHEVGKSILEEDKVSLAKEYLNKYADKLVIPIDTAMAKEFADVKPGFSKGKDIPENMQGLDIGPKTIELFNKELSGAKTIIWNGPAGVFEFKNYLAGTKAICEKVASLQGSAFTIIGGGDSATAAIGLGFEDSFSHISTGGGASLAFFEGKILPGIDTIQDK